MSSTEFSGPLVLSNEAYARVLAQVGPFLTQCSVCASIGQTEVQREIEFINDIPLILVTCPRCGNIQFHNLEPLGVFYYNGMVLVQEEEVEVAPE